MTLNELMTAIADHFDCICKLESDDNTVLLETSSPEGQDVVFECELPATEDPDCEERVIRYVRALETYATEYDPDEEAALWIGPDGHGKNGAPYRLRDLLDDMEWCKRWFEQVAKFARDKLEDNKKSYYRVPLLWQMYGHVTVEAHSEKEAAEIAIGPDTPLPEGEYVDGSCRTDDNLFIENLGLVTE